MAKALNTHRPTESSSTDLSVPIIAWTTEYRAKNDGDSSTLESIAVPLGAPSSFGFDYSTIKNIYNNSVISPATQSASKRGCRVHLKCTETWDVTDTADSTYVEQLPVLCHITLQIPQNSMIAASDVLGLIARTAGGLYDGDSTTSRLEALLRGAVTPLNL